jgi:hypothetical protein
MRRAQALLVVIVLLTAPLSLLARSTSTDMPECGGMCCLPHHGAHNSGSPHPAPQTHDLDGESCDHGSTGNMPKCTIGCSHAPTDYGFVSPITPTKPSSLASLSRFDSSQFAKLPSRTPNVVVGFLWAPFQPPRA